MQKRRNLGLEKEAAGSLRGSHVRRAAAAGSATRPATKNAHVLRLKLAISIACIQEYQHAMQVTICHR
jgi:hypothetical protein